MARKPVSHAPWVPPPYTLADAHAWRAMVGGTASADQQRRAAQWLIERVCGTYEMSFRPEGDRETIFAEGRRFVGLQLVKIINMPAELLARMRSEGHERNDY
jgi:hypothetical protein